MKPVGAITFLLLVVAFAAFGQQSETRELAKFNGIRTGEAIDVYLKKGDKESARVEVDGVSPGDVQTEVRENTLRVHMRPGNYKGRHSVKVYVTYVDLGRISTSSASNVFTEGVLKTSALEIICMSAGNVELNVEAESVSIEVASAGDVTLEGKAKRLNLDAGSAGSVDAYNFECENVRASAASGASVKIAVTKSLNAEASSGGSIRYRGNPTSTNTDSSSGGSVKKSS